MYHMTVFDNEGKKLLDEAIEAGTDTEAKTKGKTLLTEKEWNHHPFRIVHVSGRLVDFQSQKGKKAQ
ncbi:hypothetical protein GXN76_04530 [Kroppenstedtia pulmonis]|uniref:Uncharacterized protein n=1 Tax=Kroppenstedtia pulmonis TaxID=1380685 RepID=A0A7D4BVB9_9BACL|nr:YhzD family protein [Kroppenstedtia pulmonis]QKG83813.1 hypothetical protein GXN76_04530 [Kroppenstedtia pulmonis]